MIIRNDASYLIFFASQVGRPMMSDRSSFNTSVYHILSQFVPLTVAIRDIHKN